MEQNSQRIQAIKTIQKKLLGKKLTYREIYGLMDEIGHERLSSVLTTYFVASSFKEGFTTEELYQFTKAMVETGVQLHFKGIVADKHSTGGVAGTRTTMIIVPLIAAAGFTIPKSSSRAITSPAGTADVMEFLAKVTFTPRQIQEMVEKVGGCIVWGGHLGIAPADDVLIHVEEELSFESFDKVIMSIMAKKIAVSTNHLVLDIPVGPTMKIRHFADGEKIVAKFVALGKRFGMKIIADINESLEPAGNGVGVALEARDVLLVLEQHKDRSLALEAKALRLAGKLLDICYKDAGVKKNGEEEAKKLLYGKQALSKFREIVKAQGGDEKCSANGIKMKGDAKVIKSKYSGKIKRINNYNLNMVTKILGAPTDQYAGIELHVKTDHSIKKGDPLMTLHSQDQYKLKEAEITLSNVPVYEIEK